MADEVLEPPVKRLKLHQEGHIGQNSDMIQLSENTSVENTSTNSDDVPGTSKDNTNEENMILKKSTEEEIDNSDNLSEISNLSGLSEESWKPTSGAMMWIHKQIMSGVNPRPILKDLIPDDTLIPDNLDDFTIWKIVINILSEPPPRKKLSHINTLQDVLHLLQTCQNIMVLTGAGVSVSCGIPDFRSRDGIYARLAVDFPDLPDPQAMFDISYFRNDPRPFFKFAKEIYPGQFEPSAAHKFINTLEKKDKLLRNYTQNIDTLEQVAGISKVITCHGSFATATCMMCKHKVDAEVVREDIFNQVIPKCPICPSDNAMAIMKPDIVFFGESLSDEFHKQMTEDKDKCDLLIVIGSSLKVRPVALIPSSLPEDVPQILINREPLKHLNFDVELLGDCDTIVEELCKNLNWDNKSRSPVLHEISKCELKTPTPSELGEGDETTTSTESDSSALSSNGSADDKISKGSAENMGSVHCQSSNESLNDQSCNKRNISELNDEIECNDQSENDTKDCCVDTFKGNNQEKNNKSNNCVLTNGDADDKHIVVFKDEETSARTNCQNENEPNDLKCSSQVQCAAVVDMDNDKTNESSNEKGDVRIDESLPSTSNTADSSNDSRKSVLSEESKTSDEDDLEVIRSMWKPHHHSSMAKRLGEKQYLFLPPSRYVFSGAEVYSDMENDDSDSEEDSDNSSNSSTSDDELESIMKDDEKADSESIMKDDEKKDSVAKDDEKKDSVAKDDEKKDSVAKDDEKKDSVVKEHEKKDSVVKDDEKKDSESLVYLVNGDKEDLMHDKPDLCMEGTEGQDLNGEINGSDIIHENSSCTNHCNGSSSSISHCEPEPICKINGGMHQDYDELEQIDTSFNKERIDKKNIPNGTIEQHLN